VRSDLLEFPTGSLPVIRAFQTDKPRVRKLSAFLFMIDYFKLAVIRPQSVTSGNRSKNGILADVPEGRIISYYAFRVGNGQVPITTSDWSSHVISPSATEKFRASLRGLSFCPGEPGYEDARKIHNAMIDRRPAKKRWQQ
jgi:hypothetical protein